MSRLTTGVALVLLVLPETAHIVMTWTSVILPSHVIPGFAVLILLPVSGVTLVQWDSQEVKDFKVKDWNLPDGTDNAAMTWMNAMMVEMEVVSITPGVSTRRAPSTAESAALDTLVIKPLDVTIDQVFVQMARSVMITPSVFVLPGLTTTFAR